MSEFTRFPDLPTELRLEIWKAYFAVSHGTQFHIFHSTPQGTAYTNQDALSCLPGSNTLAAARVSAEAWEVFRKNFHVGDTRTFLPQSSLRDAHGLLIDNPDDADDALGPADTPPLRAIYAAAAREELRKQTVEFAFAPDDMFYIVDGDIHPIIAALSAAPWARHVQRLMVQTLCFKPSGLDSGFTLGLLMRQPRGWQSIFSSPPESVRRILNGPSLRQLLFVTIPNELKHGYEGFHDEYGLLRVASVCPYTHSGSFTNSFNQFATIKGAQLCHKYPSLEGKIDYVVDALPARWKFKAGQGTQSDQFRRTASEGRQVYY
ncbi:hypothetical protein F4808DRAFT_421679 [Astrocystis sublimbata]|nr:hypothetical protein F4808DRAFT_421679 [Astrocystis sublimbata]